jgi:hypothetical protein
VSRHQPHRVGRRFPPLQAQAESLADVVEQLFAAFERKLPLSTVVAVVRRTRRELETRSGPPSPPAVEQLARARLHRLADAQPAHRLS